jgi:hypothetical protein
MSKPSPFPIEQNLSTEGCYFFFCFLSLLGWWNIANPNQDVPIDEFFHPINGLAVPGCFYFKNTQIKGDSTPSA